MHRLGAERHGRRRKGEDGGAEAIEEVGRILEDVAVMLGHVVESGPLLLVVEGVGVEGLLYPGLNIGMLTAGLEDWRGYGSRVGEGQVAGAR